MKWSADVKIEVTLGFGGIEADTEEEAKEIAENMAYEKVSFEYGEDYVSSIVWQEDKKRM